MTSPWRLPWGQAAGRTRERRRSSVILVSRWFRVNEKRVGPRAVKLARRLRRPELSLRTSGVPPPLRLRYNESGRETCQFSKLDLTAASSFRRSRSICRWGCAWRCWRRRPRRHPSSDRNGIGSSKNCPRPRRRFPALKKRFATRESARDPHRCRRHGLLGWLPSVCSISLRVSPGLSKKDSDRSPPLSGTARV